MKLSELKVGCWYTSSHWHSGVVAKFHSLIHYGHNDVRGVFSESYNPTTRTYKDVSIVLGDDNVDFKELKPRMVRNNIIMSSTKLSVRRFDTNNTNIDMVETTTAAQTSKKKLIELPTLQTPIK